MRENLSDLSIGPYRGCIAEDYRAQDFLSELSNISSVVSAAAGNAAGFSRNRVAKVNVTRDGAPFDISVKSFSSQNVLKDLVDRSRGSRGRRSWLIGCALHERGVGTPTPIGFLDRWCGNRLCENYLLTAYSSGVTSFRDELIRLYTEDPVCRKVMSLMECVAQGIRRMHDAGIAHGDLGNQNILLKRTGDAEWGDVQFIDLNRGRVREEVCLRDRAFDISRIALPSDFLRVLKEMYWQMVPPAAFQRWEGCYRRLFSLHTRTRPLRHPLRALRDSLQTSRDCCTNGRSSTANHSETTCHAVAPSACASGRRRKPREYPPVKDIWIWDDRSVQPVSPMTSKERRRYHSLWRDPRLVGTTLSCALPVFRRYRALKNECFEKEVQMKDRVGIAISPEPGAEDDELALLNELGNIPVIVRFYHHDSEEQWDFTADIMRQLHATGSSVSAALVQDRRAVSRPDEWKDFVEHVVSAIADCVELVEVGHAVNRAKWGIWNFAEYGRLMDALAGIQKEHPQVHLMGPAVIDFEYPVVVTALQIAARRVRFHALSHHLYVDRRGAPENRQGSFALIEKLALARAIAEWTSGCEGGVVVSETNWPLTDTGVYSPVGSPYVSPGPRKNDPSVSEQTYSDFMIRYLLQAVCSGMAERIYWWRLVARGFGLVDDTHAGKWRPRPAFDALRFFVATLGTATYKEELASPEGVAVFMFETSGGDRIVVAYSSRGPIRMEMPFSYSRLASSVGSEIGGGGALELTGSPVYLLDVQR